MRHAASLIASLEGMSRQAFLIAKELAQNSRSGLTVRFLSKKLEILPEEVEYLVDVNAKLLYSDLTRVKLVPEGMSAVKRIVRGLENRGDVPSLYHLIKSLDAHEFRRIEERIGIDKPGGKKTAFDELLDRCYRYPESVVDYVATRSFSPRAQELFDIVWQSKDGVLPVCRIRAKYEGSDFDVEQGLWELFQGFALFEMFRFDGEDRLVRAVGLLSEVRQARTAIEKRRSGKRRLKPISGQPVEIDSRGTDLSDRVCRLVAAIAAKPVRVRGDGDLFREDRRRLEDICLDDNPSISACLWMAQGAGWLARVDNELRVGNLESLITQDRLSRHRALFRWMTSSGNEAASRRVLADMLDEVKTCVWYPIMDFIEHAREHSPSDERPVLKSGGGHWNYASPGAASNAERSLARSLEEAFLWFGVVDRGEAEDGSVFRLTTLGHALLTDESCARIREAFPERGAELVVQPNFDIVVPLQDVDPLLTVPLDRFCSRASSGQATVYRLEKESFTRAIQEGHDGAAFIEFLIGHNRGRSLPANVVQTLDDWRGGIKHVRIRTLHVLEADDPLVMAELVHRRRLGKHFEQIDPHKVVTYTKVSKSSLIKELEREGFVVD